MKTNYAWVYFVHVKLGTTHIIGEERETFLVQTDFFSGS